MWADHNKRGAVGSSNTQFPVSVRLFELTAEPPRSDSNQMAPKNGSTTNTQSSPFPYHPHIPLQTHTQFLPNDQLLPAVPVLSVIGWDFRNTPRLWQSEGVLITERGLTTGYCSHRLGMLDPHNESDTQRLYTNSLKTTNSDQRPSVKMRYPL